jgi:hypothetical protein
MTVKDEAKIVVESKALGKIVKCIAHPSISSAEVCHTGGGVMGIFLQFHGDTRTMFWGTAGGILGADVSAEDGDLLDSVETGASTESSPETMAQVIVQSSVEWMQAHPSTGT